MMARRTVAAAMAVATVVAIASTLAMVSAEKTSLAFAGARIRSSTFDAHRVLDLDASPFHNQNRPPLSTLAPSFFPQTRQINTKRSLTRTSLYRKFHDYGWKKLMSDSDADILDTVPEELKSNTSPAKGAPPGTNVVVNIRSISKFPFLAENENDLDDDGQVLRLARSAFLETQSPTNDALITPMTIHVLNFVLFPSPHIRDVNIKDDENGGYLGLPIFGADIVSLPGNKHLVALDFQPVLPLNNDNDSSEGKEKASLIPKQYADLESKLETIHAKYQKSDSDSAPILPWGGDIPPQAERFFSPYALWTRLGEENAMDTVNTAVWEAFQEYTDLYFELMSAVQKDVDAGKLEVALANEKEAEGNNPVWKGQIDYLEYRRTNDPARPMLQRLYGNDWAESVIGDVLFPGL